MHWKGRMCLTPRTAGVRHHRRITRENYHLRRHQQLQLEATLPPSQQLDENEQDATRGRRRRQNRDENEQQETNSRRKNGPTCDLTLNTQTLRTN
ncbi:hypothetical protein ElyMa_003362400 [Elysia marginata]|uniref:Uncharacterized protein n=1 Tax=Elysia marginata TaxID=1093978 RepID=A0AAV4JLF7_9GAST|nr:hypothetical protein ElyMa_003362400 [Elysia marginata]